MSRSRDEQLCLEFVNTMAWRKTGRPEERMPAPADLLRWCGEAGTVPPGSAKALRRRWDRHPEEAGAFHRRAIALREAIYGLFLSRIRGEAMGAGDLDLLNGRLSALPPRRVLGAGPEGAGWLVPASGTALDILAPVLWSAADLLTGPRAHRIRQCEDPQGCGWLFLDESRAGTRRWCSMGSCGNRAKARRHYLRTKQRETPRPEGPFD